MDGKVNPWTEQAFKQAERRGGDIVGILAVVQVQPGQAQAVASKLRGEGYSVQGVVDDFVFCDLPEPGDFDKVSGWSGVIQASMQKTVSPMAVGIDDLFTRIAVLRNPVLSKLSKPELAGLGISFKAAAQIPTPLTAAFDILSTPIDILKNPEVNLKKILSGFPPMLTKKDWKLVTYTRQLMEAPADNVLSDGMKVAVIDTGVNPPPPLPYIKAVGVPFVDYDIISLTVEPPVDTMGHGSWCSSCAFGRTAENTRYGKFVPVSSAKRYLHVKVFSALGPATSFQIMKAMELCAQRGVQVVSMSLGGALMGSVEDDPECALVESLYKKYGTNFVIAAGNDGANWSINSPGASPYVLTVGAMDWKQPKASSYTSMGPQGQWYKDNPSVFDEHLQKYGDNFLKPDVAGIGGDENSQIVAACTPWFDGINDYLPNGYDMMIGTSMATPHVAGITALALDRYYIDSIDEVKMKMSNITADKDTAIGYGLLKYCALV